MLADRVKARRGTRRLSKDRAAELAGMSPVTWTRVEDALPVRVLTYSGIENVLGWAGGSIKAYLDSGDVALLPVDDPEAAADAGVAGPRADLDGDPTFADALALHREALLQLRRVAAADPGVPDEVVDLLDDMNMMAVALEYGGVTQVRKAIADSYQRSQLGEQPSHRAG